ncbi:MAG: putative rane protein, partial [Microbacterium sp.]|nr:putative rane protein [Microbacterium sp.]
IWGFGLTVIGYLVSLIPGVGEFVAKYIDVILLAAVVGTVFFIVWHYFAEKRKAKKEMAAGPDEFTDADEARELVLDPEVFREHGHGGPHAHRPEASTTDTDRRTDPRS